MTEAPAAAAALPSGFQEQIVFSGLSEPTDLEFSPDGRVFVAEKGGRIKVFDDLADTTPAVFADLSTNVHNMWDRGLLGLALPPNFPTSPWVYVLYTYDAPPGQTAPVYRDDCSGVSGGANGGRCVVTGRLSKLQAAGNVMTGSEQVLIHDWCQQFPSHSVGDVGFGADGMLYVTGGDGASFGAVDYGQQVGSLNPCNDPPGGAMSPPNAQGGALRTQDLRTTSDPTTLDGAVLRLDPTTGAAAADNPLIGSADPNARRIVAHGLRNPFRLTMRPGTNEVWISETGWTAWEEINRLVNPTAGVTNFGWPCYEGTPRQPGYDSANLAVCEDLYAAGAGAVAAPYVAWNHSSQLVPGEACPTGVSSSTGVAFYPTGGGPYPAAYRGAAFFADYSRKCIWAMLPSTPGGLPSPSNIITFGSGVASPVDLEVGPGGELYYIDPGGTIRRIRYFPGNQPPTAVINAAPTRGPAPLTVAFHATGSTDPDPADDGHLTYQWDFTNDGTTDSTAPSPTFTYTAAGTHTARLTVTDTLGAIDTATVTITPGNDAPMAVIDTPTMGTTWRVGQTINFSGHATDAQQGTLPTSALTWHLRMQHCSAPGNCHAHFLQDWTGVASGSFVAPDHEYPSYLELELVATDADNVTHSVVRRLDPRTVQLTFTSRPLGLQLTVGSSSQATPFARTVIEGSTNSVSAPSPQRLGGSTYTFARWDDGGDPSQVITAPTSATTYTATYTGQPDANLALNKPASGDSQCAPAEGPGKAVNGGWTGGLSDKWCSTGAGKWLRVDLGSTANISRFVVRHAGAGGESTRFNTRAFTIEVSGDGTTWTRAVTVAANTANVTTHDVTAVGRYVRLNVTTPTQTSDPAARIYELEAYGGVGSPQPDVNLALNKPASGDSQCAPAEGPGKAVNGGWTGGLSDKWCSTGAGKWLRVDLGSTANISRFVVRHAGAGGESTRFNTRAFTIEVSGDGTTWTRAVTVAANTANVTTHDVTAVGRYVRLNVTTPTQTSDPAARIYELEAYGGVGSPQPDVNLALNKPASGDSQCAPAEGPGKAVNGGWTGGLSDKWCSTGAGKWLRVDLGSTANISRFVVRHAGAGGESTRFNTRAFTIEVSGDGTTWTRAVTVAANTANVTTHDVTAVGRYVRLNVTTPTQTSDPAARIYELEAYGGVGSPQPDVNLALNKPASGDSQCAPAEGPGKAVNGGWTGGLSDKWCSTGAGKWLRVDLGSTANISRFVVRHAGAGGESTRFNTRAFTIEVSGDGTTWTRAVTVAANTANVTTHDVTAVGRYVRLNVTTPTQTSDPAARIYELEAYS
ncbi:discoidin domain-containing protein [Micromonospora sp. WMMD812]|nr:discoidin domain-containing protein [Micromonospora sp. WMMD812]WBB67606.1 discoidin domain-containing protein [Micromonospora sp. WMMD812]